MCVNSIMVFDIYNVCVDYNGTKIKNNKNMYYFTIKFKFTGARKVTGHILDPSFDVVGQFKETVHGSVKFCSDRLGFYKLIVADAYETDNTKKVKFDVKLPKKQSSSSASSVSSKQSISVKSSRSSNSRRKCKTKRNK